MFHVKAICLSTFRALSILSSPLSKEFPRHKQLRRGTAEASQWQHSFVRQKEQKLESRALESSVDFVRRITLKSNCRRCFAPSHCSSAHQEFESTPPKQFDFRLLLFCGSSTSLFAHSKQLHSRTVGTSNQCNQFNDSISNQCDRFNDSRVNNTTFRPVLMRSSSIDHCCFAGEVF